EDFVVGVGVEAYENSRGGPWAAAILRPCHGCSLLVVVVGRLICAASWWQWCIARVVVAARRRRKLRALDRRRGAGALVPCLRVHGVHDAVRRCVGLRAPPLREEAEVDRVVTDLVEVLADDLLRLEVVARDGEGAAVRGAGGAGESSQVLEEDVVEALDHP